MFFFQTESKRINLQTISQSHRIYFGERFCFVLLLDIEKGSSFTEYENIKKLYSCIVLGHSIYACKCICVHTQRGFCRDNSRASRTELAGSCTNRAARGHSRTVLVPIVL